jgi:hypothetical protein
MARNRMPLAVLLSLTVGPTLAIGMVLWVLLGTVPDCTVTEHSRATAPDGQFDLVTFSRACGDTSPNMQAALVPPGEDVPFDAASFVSIGADADLAPRWDGFGSVELTIPSGAEIYRQDDAVAGVAVIYR